MASDLSEIGSSRSPAAIQQALLDPSSLMMPINRPVRAVTKDGRTINGRRLNEDTFTIQLLTDQEQLLTVQKSDLKEFRILTTASMPSYKDKLGPPQLPTSSHISPRSVDRGEGRPGADRARRRQGLEPRKVEAGRERRRHRRHLLDAEADTLDRHAFVTRNYR